VALSPWETKQADFKDDTNVGVRLGTVSNGITDFDCDWEESRLLAAYDPILSSLPAFGKGTTASHYVFFSSLVEHDEQEITKAEATAAGLVADTNVPHACCINELRAKDGSKSIQTVFPGSVVDGKKVIWLKNFDGTIPSASVEMAANIRKAVKFNAFLAVVLRKYPSSKGGRDKICMALAGTLLRAGYSVEDTDRWITVIATLKNDEKVALRRKAAHTQKEIADGHEVTGLPKLCEQLGVQVIEKRLRRWLGMDEPKAAITGVDSEGWKLDQHGKRLANSVDNIRIGFKQLGVALSYDTFAKRLMIQRDGETRQLHDNDFTTIRVELHDRFGLPSLPAAELFDAILKAECLGNKYHPVRDYLAEMQEKWDGEERISRWLITYGGADDTPYTRNIGRMWMIAAVRRIRQPGCKFDQIPVVESPQGKRKSTAMGILAKKPEWFTDNFSFSASSLQKIEAIQGKWIVEAPELDGLRRRDIESVKAFISRTSDNGVRMAYGRVASDHPRECVFIGTTNGESYLTDTTGNRRFWPVRVKQFDLEALRRDVDQLWGEAAAAESTGEKTYLDGGLETEAEAVQEQRRLSSSIEDALTDYLDGLAGRIAASEIWKVLGINDLAKRNTLGGSMNAAMIRLGWTKGRKRGWAAGKATHCYAKGDSEKWIRFRVANGQTYGSTDPVEWEVDEGESPSTVVQPELPHTIEGSDLI
jgi:predicted P-loop ATPase